MVLVGFTMETDIVAYLTALTHAVQLSGNMAHINMSSIAQKDKSIVMHSKSVVCGCQEVKDIVKRTF